MNKLKEIIFKNIITIIATFFVIFLLIIYTSEYIFGSLIDTDSLKPLWVILPAFVAIAAYLIFSKKE